MLCSLSWDLRSSNQGTYFLVMYYIIYMIYNETGILANFKAQMLYLSRYKIHQWWILCLARFLINFRSGFQISAEEFNRVIRQFRLPTQPESAIFLDVEAEIWCRSIHYEFYSKPGNADTYPSPGSDHVRTVLRSSGRIKAELLLSFTGYRPARPTALGERNGFQSSFLFRAAGHRLRASSPGLTGPGKEKAPPGLVSGPCRLG